MSSELRILMFIGWAIIVSLAFAELTFSSSPVFGPLVLSIAWLPFHSWSEYTKPIPRASSWKVTGVVVVLVGLLLYGGFPALPKRITNGFSRMLRCVAYSAALCGSYSCRAAITLFAQNTCRALLHRRRAQAPDYSPI